MSAPATNQYDIVATRCYSAVSAPNEPETIVDRFGEKSYVVWKKNGALFPSNAISEGEQIISDIAQPRIIQVNSISGQGEGPSYYSIKETVTRQILTTPLLG